MIKIGLLGLGTVGGGVVNVLNKNLSIIKERINCDVKIICAALKDINKDTICDTSGIELTENATLVVNNPDVDIVIELIGGVDFAKSLVEQALKNGKHVITANKALIAHHGNELLDLANKNNVALLFEASVAGGIPIIKVIQQGLSANKIQMIVGIINGTGNFILTQMAQKNSDFNAALTQAQELGYAEADPTFDVEGIDAAHKLAILSALAFGSKIAFYDVITEGISKISAQDIRFANELGYSIKHLGISKIDGDKIEMRVHPTLIPKETLLANVNGVMNAVLVRANAVGETAYYGAGAGSEATASAVIADLIDIINDDYTNIKIGVDANYIVDADIQSAYYIHLLVNDKTGVLADISKILANHNISVEAVIQHANNDQANIAIISSKVKTRDMLVAVNEINACDFIIQEAKTIRVEE